MLASGHTIPSKVGTSIRAMFFSRNWGWLNRSQNLSQEGELRFVLWKGLSCEDWHVGGA